MEASDLEESVSACCDKLSCIFLSMFFSASLLLSILLFDKSENLDPFLFAISTLGESVLDPLIAPPYLFLLFFSVVTIESLPKVIKIGLLSLPARICMLLLRLCRVCSILPESENLEVMMLMFRPVLSGCVYCVFNAFI